MDRRCWNCLHWKGEGQGDIKGLCEYKNEEVRGILMCPAHLEDKNKIPKLDSATELQVKIHSAKPSVPVKRKRSSEPMLIFHDDYRPDLVPFGHQKEAIERYKTENAIALFFEMGCGKSFTTLQIAQEKYKAGQIEALLVVAPNDVHRQWFDELVFGVDKDHDGILWQELQVDFEAQCVGGRGGQSELYEFEREDTFKFISVNVDTFSTPHKWEPIVQWCNQHNTMIAIDEATVIKNHDSKRSQRLLYEFNDTLHKGKRIIANTKKPNTVVRAVLTGTPVTNGPIDLWSIMEFVEPNYFNRNYYSFRSYYGMFTKLNVMAGGIPRDIQVLLTEKTWQGVHDCEDYGTAYNTFGVTEDTYMTIKHQDKFMGPYKHADELREQLNVVATFKKLTDCVDMPPVKYIVRKVGMSPAQQAAYDNMKKDYLVKYNDYLTTATNKLIVSLRLQQISSGFIMGHKEIDFESMIDDDTPLWNDIETDVMPDEVVWLGDSNPKLDALMSDIAEIDKPILILTRYSAEAAKIYDMCIKTGYRTGLFTGWKVVGGIDDFKEGKLDILVANSNKISRGFNLQVAHTTLFYSNTFSMEVRQQAEFRTFRMGQTHTCLYIDYSAADVDDTIINAIAMKKNLLEYIREKDVKEVV